MIQRTGLNILRANVATAEADYSVSSRRLLLRACEPAVILWFQFSSGGFLSCPPLEQVQWSETWSAAGLPPGWIHCHLLELQPCALSEILLGSVPADMPPIGCIISIYHARCILRCAG